MEPLKILLVLHTPWTPDLGLPRCSIELAGEFRERGHVVDRFDLCDAFPRRTRLGAFFEHALFPRRAVEFVRRHGHEYDVVQAEQGNLPVSKHALGYDGVLVCRSDGLVHFYVEWLREHGRKRKPARGSLPGAALRSLATRLDGGVGAVERSFAFADAIVLLNHDELRFVTDRLGHGDKALVLPNGLSEDCFAALAAAAGSPERRHAAQHVVLVGHLSERKGLSDLPTLVRRIRELLPHARVSFLGAGLPAKHVLPLFAPQDRDRLRVVESFAPDELPSLLCDATVGILPSYLEGFPLGALEQLAAGVPTVAYDAPGSRELLRSLPSALTPLGDPDALAAEVARVLSLPQPAYAALAEQAREVAGRFRWAEIADQTLAAYEEAGARRDR